MVLYLVLSTQNPDYSSTYHILYRLIDGCHILPIELSRSPEDLYIYNFAEYFNSIRVKIDTNIHGVMTSIIDVTINDIQYMSDKDINLKYL